MSASEKNVEYERFVRGIVETVLRAQGLQTVRVEHDVQVRGTSRSYQIDVYWEYRLGGVLHRVIINCKRYTHAVEVGDVLELGGVLSDMPGVRGLIVTTVGYQKGAIEYAKTHGIGLKIVRAPQDGDWNGRIRTIEGHITITSPELLSFKVDLNSEWVNANVADPATVSGTKVFQFDAATVRDIETGDVKDLNELWNQAIRENPTEVGKETTGTVRWNDARLEQPGELPLRIDAMTFGWRITAGETLTIRLRSAPDAIVRDAIAGSLLFIDPDGRITGDVEEELGRGRG